MKTGTARYCLLFLFLMIFFAAGFAKAITIDTSIPGLNTATTNDPAQCGAIFGFYNYALAIAGILAFGAITYGGVLYTLAAGNPSGQSTGKEWVLGAIYGLLLLVGAYFILHFINPDITQCGLTPLPAISTSPAWTGTGVTGLPTAGCVGGTCASLSASGFTCKDPSTCGAAPAEVSALQCVQQKSGQALRISEGYPPTVPHISQCHDDGCCVDLTPASYPNVNCAQVQAIVSAATACGAVVANEYPSCGGQVYSTSQGNNIHIQGCQ